MIKKGIRSLVVPSLFTDKQFDVLVKRVEEKKRDEIIRLLKVAPNTIADVWAKLEKQGLLVKEGKDYRKLV